MILHFIITRTIGYLFESTPTSALFLFQHHFSLKKKKKKKKKRQFQLNCNETMNETN